MFPGTMRRIRRPTAGSAAITDHHRCRCCLDPKALIKCEGAHTLPDGAELTACQLHELVYSLPGKYQQSQWSLVFTSDVDGHSLSHMYRELEPFQGKAGIVLLVVQERGASVAGRAQLGEIGIIGAFVTELPTLCHGQHAFFGARDSFVFSFGGHQQEHAGLQIYRWGGKNEDFLVCSSRFVGIGGGEHGAAIFIDSELQIATSSAQCQTFDSPPLHGTPYRGLHHSELLIRQTMWFALEEHSFAPFYKHLTDDNFATASLSEGCRFDVRDAVDHHHHCQQFADYLATHRKPTNT